MSQNYFDDKEQELAILRQVLKPHFSDFADIKYGYQALRELFDVLKADPSLIDSKINGYYREIVEVVSQAYANIQETINTHYDSGDRNELPAFYINSNPFEKELYIPFSSLFDQEPLWSDVDQTYDECSDRINAAWFFIVGKDGELKAPHEQLFHDAKLATHQVTTPYTCGELILDLVKGTIKFGDNEAIKIGVDRQEIQLLKLLLQNKNRVVPYMRIASKLDLDYYHSEADPKEVASRLRYLKKDLGKLLGEAGMSKKIFDEKITSQRGEGYILTCD